MLLILVFLLNCPLENGEAQQQPESLAPNSLQGLQVGSPEQNTCLESPHEFLPVRASLIARAR